MEKKHFEDLNSNGNVGKSGKYLNSDDPAKFSDDPFRLFLAMTVGQNESNSFYVAKLRLICF